jgi:hypothetical protein
MVWPHGILPLKLKPLIGVLVVCSAQLVVTGCTSNTKTIPDVRDHTESWAVERLQALGFKTSVWRTSFVVRPKGLYGETDDTNCTYSFVANGGLVTAQRPGPGAEAPVGSTVKLWTCQSTASESTASEVSGWGTVEPIGQEGVGGYIEQACREAFPDFWNQDEYEMCLRAN